MEKATIHMNLYVLALSEYLTNQLYSQKKKNPNNQLQEIKQVFVQPWKYSLAEIDIPCSQNISAYASFPS